MGGLREDGEAPSFRLETGSLGKQPARFARLTRPNFTLNKCVTDTPLSESILPLMRGCFFGGAMHAVFLLQKGYCDQLASENFFGKIGLK
jgi:hypothetical protein